jgi:acetylornithine/N-succinyldiaminopimelate aminotransferase
MSLAQKTIELENTYEALTYDRYPVVFTHGRDCYLFDTEGKRYVDLYGGHCVSILGHTPSKVSAAIQNQAETLFFYSNVAYSPVRATTAEALIKAMPEGFDRVFFCNSGTEANENAIKLAWKMTGKTRLVSTNGGWHGRTLASLSITDDPKIRKGFEFALLPGLQVPFGDAQALEECLSSHSDIAAFILEPIQSIAGIVTAPDEYFRSIRTICDKYGVLLIFDEIQTGVGRTGAFSISEWFGMRPDLITMAKSLASGMPIGAVFMPERIASQLKTGDLGSTFAGGPLVMAACAATLDQINEDRLMEHARKIYHHLEEQLRGSEILMRGRGALIGLELPVPYSSIKNTLFDMGWLTGSSAQANVMRLMPPLITPFVEIERFAQDLLHVVKEQHS